jgi:hypothetical protein
MLFQTIYVSTALGKPSPQDLDGILDQSRRNNNVDDITGLLLYHDGNFFQILEGPKDKVEACYGHIERDPRHSGCLVLLTGDIEARSFASWDMGFIPFSDLEAGQQKNYFDLRDIWNSPKIYEAMQRRELDVLLYTFLSTLRRI